MKGDLGEPGRMGSPGKDVCIRVLYHTLSTTALVSSYIKDCVLFYSIYIYIYYIAANVHT